MCSRWYLHATIPTVTTFYSEVRALATKATYTVVCIIHSRYTSPTGAADALLYFNIFLVEITRSDSVALVSFELFWSHFLSEMEGVFTGRFFHQQSSCDICPAPAPMLCAHSINPWSHDLPPPMNVVNDRLILIHLHRRMRGTCRQEKLITYLPMEIHLYTAPHADALQANRSRCVLLGFSQKARHLRPRDLPCVLNYDCSKLKVGVFGDVITRIVPP